MRCEYVCVLRTHHCCRGAVALLNSAARGHVTAMACYAPAGCTISGVALCAGHLMRCDVMCFGAKSRVPRGVLRLFLRVAAWRGRRRGRRSAARPVSENITVGASCVPGARHRGLACAHGDSYFPHVKYTSWLG